MHMHTHLQELEIAGPRSGPLRGPEVDPVAGRRAVHRRARRAAAVTRLGAVDRPFVGRRGLAHRLV